MLCSDFTTENPLKNSSSVFSKSREVKQNLHFIRKGTKTKKKTQTFNELNVHLCLLTSKEISQTKNGFRGPTKAFLWYLDRNHWGDRDLLFWKLEEVIVDVYKILHNKEMGCGWTAWSLFQSKHYRDSDKAKSKINKRTWISMQLGSFSALWVQKLNTILRKKLCQTWR